jgi:DNA end-binding protein Ku
MARPIWSGVLTLGLVTVPVTLHTATEDHTTRFHQLQRGTSDRIRNRRVNERTGKEVASGDIVKGFDAGDGGYVVVEPEELDQIAPGKSQTVDVRGFVDLAAVAPVFFARTYYLAPKGEEYAKVYGLLCRALADAGKAGVATFVMRGREYLTALRAQDDVLVLHTMRWADEIRDPHKELPPLPRSAEPRAQELAAAQQLIDALSIDWRPQDYRDTYEERVRALVDAKRKGEEVVAEAGPPTATNVVDLMDALQQSVDRARGRGGDTGDRGEEEGEGRRPGRRRAPTGRARSGTRPNKPATGRKANGGGKRKSRGRAEVVSGLSRDELYRRAADLGIPGRSKMNRAQLADAVAHGRAS